jgi:hypothetical protein
MNENGISKTVFSKEIGWSTNKLHTTHPHCTMYYSKLKLYSNCITQWVINPPNVSKLNPIDEIWVMLNLKVNCNSYQTKNVDSLIFQNYWKRRYLEIDEVSARQRRKFDFFLWLGQYGVDRNILLILLN